MDSKLVVEQQNHFSVGMKERLTLRELAQRIRELAGRPGEEVKKSLWTRHNDLEETRPLVFCDPENGWNEIIPADQLLCAHPFLRDCEMTLRKEIFWGERMGDDRVIEPFLDLPYIHEDTGWGLMETRIGGENGGAYTWNAPIEEYERDFPKLKFPEIRIDFDATRRVVELAQDILGDLLQVRLKGRWWWSLGMTWDYIKLRGLDNLMLDMYDHPGWVHKIMAFLSDGTRRKLNFLEENGLLALNTEGTYVGSGGFGWTRQLPQRDFDSGKVRTMDMWGFAESQETVGLSPEMFAEFIFPYQKPILERFGLNCYGCCEPLDSRWPAVSLFPRLRRVSVSPWSNRDRMAEMLGKGYIFSLKPSPSPLAQPQLDEAWIRQSVRADLQAAKNCRVEIVMKDNHTIGRNPDNVIRWCRIAREEAERL
jgi:hypothetical protein